MRRLWAHWLTEGAEPDSRDGRSRETAPPSRLDLRTDAPTICALATAARRDPHAVTALLALLAPVWIDAKRRWVSLELGELTDAMLSINLDAPSTCRDPVGAIIRRAVRQSDRTFWSTEPPIPEPNHGRRTPAPARVTPDPAPAICLRLTVGELLDSDRYGCTRMRLDGHTTAAIARRLGSNRRARAAIRAERLRLASALGLPGFRNRTGHLHLVRPTR